MIEDLFKAAKDAGAEEVDPSAPAAKKSSNAAFKVAISATALQ